MVTNRLDAILRPTKQPRERSIDSAADSLHILLVEDNADDVLLFEEALHECRFAPRPAVARDGVEALEYLRREGRFAGIELPDLVLLDLNLPRKDGREVLESIKSDPVLEHVPVVVLSSSSSEDDIGRCYEANANCYVSKPFEFDGFVNTVKVIMSFWLRYASLPK